ncbi:MAG TPA: hypothetical protein VF100_10920 [Thermoanaerobaculia bacterium]
MFARATLLAVLLVAAVAVAADAAPACRSADDLDFLASLAEPDAGVPAIGTPAPQSTVCNASSNCGDGNTVTCQGNWTCQVTGPGVKCDGNEVRCPNYCQIGMGCQCCDGFHSVFCTSRTGGCAYTSGGITCGSGEITCEESCPDCPDW